MRALAVLGVAFACAYGCGGDEPSPPVASAGAGGEAGAFDYGNNGHPESGAGQAAGPLGAGGAAGAEAFAVAGGGGASSEAGAAGSGSGSLLVGIVAAATRFTEYGKLRIGFEQPVDAASLTITLLPRVPDRLVVTQVSQVDEATVDATLAFYHLPRDYQLSVTGNLSDADATPFEASAMLPGLDNGARAAFISKQSGAGAFTSWAGAPAAATPVEAADSVCQSEADAAGLRGTFQAFLSLYGSFDAGCRAFGLDGMLADKCGQAEMPVDHAQFLSLDGMPIVAGATDIVADRWAIPISFHADGTPATPSYTWTGSISGAKAFANVDCSGWTTTTGNGLPANEIGKRLLEYEFSRSCSTFANLLCLQTAGTFFGPAKLHEVSGKRAFVSKGKLFGTMSFDGKSGVAAADALCQSEAATASLENAAKFRAYLGTTDTDALCYILGQTGKVVDHCGLTALPDADPWRRVDDYPIGTAAQLAAGTLAAPLSLAADATLLTNERPRTGTELDGSTSWNCGDWASTGAYSLSGHPGYVSGDWTSHWTTDCDGEETSVYCFEN